MADARFKDVIEFIDNLNFNEIINVNFSHSELMQEGERYFTKTYFQKEEPITLFFKGYLFRDFISMRRNLYSTLNKKKFNISEEYIEETLLDCVLMHYDNVDYKTYLQKQVLNNISTFTIYYAIEGLNLKNNIKLKMADSIFFKVTKQKLKLISDTGYDEQLGTDKHNDILNRTYCEINIEATDPAAAKSITLTSLSKNIDTLNFIAGLLKNRNLISGYVYYPNYSFDTQHNKIFIQKNSKLIKTNYSWNHPRVFDLSILKNEQDLYQLFNRIIKYSKSVNHNIFINGLLTAIQWCGKAMWEERSEIAFMNYITSLESILLTSKDGELSFRLSLYGSFLVSKYKSKRKFYFDKIKYLYDLRSIITHQGNYEVDKNDLMDIREITISVILGIIYSKKYNFIKSTDLEDFDKRLKLMVLN